MKKLFIMLAMVMTAISLMMGSALASPKEDLGIGSLLQRSKANVFIEAYDLRIGEEEKGGEQVANRRIKVDTLIGMQQLVSNNEKLPATVASPHSKKMRISAVLLDMNEAVKLHATLAATNNQTASKQVGQVFRWGTEEYQPASDAIATKLAKMGITNPVKMTIIACKEKDKQSNLIKALKGLVAVTGIWKTANDWHNDYADLTPLLTSAFMLQSIAAGNGNSMMFGGVSPQTYAVSASQLSGGF